MKLSFVLVLTGALLFAVEGTLSYVRRDVALPKTRSLSGGYATDGRNETNDMVLMLLKVGLLGGYAVRKVKMFNDRVFLARYRRSYWLGSRYYYLDNLYFLETRDTCAYRMNETERNGLEYEDGVPIVDVIFQCQRYAEHCCGLDCCLNKGKRWTNVALDYVATSSVTSHFTFAAANLLLPLTLFGLTL